MDAVSLGKVVEEAVRRTLAGLTGAELRPAPPPVAVPVGVSNRHVHLSHDHVKTLFGSDASLSLLRDLSQPGQFVAAELVQLAGPSGAIAHVRVLGPARSRTQVELSRTDAYRLGLSPPVRDSGDLDGTPGAVLIGPVGTVILDQGVILACRHLHLPPDEAARLGLHDRQLVEVEVSGPRAGVLRNVLVRVHERYVCELHLDTDEANACGLRNGDHTWLRPGTTAAQPDLPPPGTGRSPAAGELPLTLVTERDVAAAVSRDGRLLLHPRAIVTPAAQDAARARGVTLVTVPDGGAAP